MPRRQARIRENQTIEEYPVREVRHDAAARLGNLPSMIAVDERFFEEGTDMGLDVVETLCELVSIPSVNPMGRDVAGEEFLEYAVTERLQQIFTELRLPYERQQVAPGRDNIVACLEGDRVSGKPAPMIP